MKIDSKPSFTYEEKNAIAVLRKSIKKKPSIIAELMKDASKETAVAVLLEAKAQMKQLLEVNKAFILASAELAKKKEQI